jgi:ribosomal protein S19
VCLIGARGRAIPETASTRIRSISRRVAVLPRLVGAVHQKSRERSHAAASE